MKAWALIVMLVVAACSGTNATRPVMQTQDVSPVAGAIEQFVKTGRTPGAFAELSRGIEEMRGGDSVVVSDAELRLLALAAPFVERARSRPLAAEVDELALTVWPTLLSDPLTGAARPTLLPAANESPRAYLARLCATELVCGSESPDGQAVAVRAIALRNANERMRLALARCLHCDADGREWQRLGWTLESLDNEAAHYRTVATRAQRVASAQLDD